MKLISFALGGERRIGALTGEDLVVDVTETVGSHDMNVLIERYERLRDALESEVEAGDKREPLSGVTLLAPIPDVHRNIFCVGKNYYDHAHEFASSGFDSSAARGAVPPAPIIFSKPPSSVIGPGAAIDSALDPMESVDYEAELAVVIGKAGRCTETDDPWSFIFGYTLINDVTSRGLQKHHSQWLLGKGIDTFCPMGPAIVTADAAGDVNAFELRCEVNGEVRQKALLSSLIFDIPTLVRTIGRSISFVPGDVIATGTPAGVGLGFNPPRYLRPGDRVRVSVPQIGALENYVA
ncbi:fumarylacetoacetate hydrolase family protein [Caballeronia sp. LZ008]|uniref:fumarylacetoacetate hydrolase family protein n=1 Tax=unclassified Caballeronia TaxID=2646786 RepID=UPI0020296994|nr:MULTISPECIES: fumarylacetoacetate hydrolase family protein [unclassified Caballeronia]MDR5798195.1 fumarylacetoacetate hydrolase family protein [Caballeronia sp. LZ008]